MDKFEISTEIAASPEEFLLNIGDDCEDTGLTIVKPMHGREPDEKRTNKGYKRPKNKNSQGWHQLSNNQRLLKHPDQEEPDCIQEQKNDSVIDVETSSTGKSALDLYLAEMRLLKSKSCQDEKALLKRMADQFEQLVREISRFPGSAKFIVEEYSKSSLSESDDGLLNDEQLAQYLKADPSLDSNTFFNNSTISFPHSAESDWSSKKKGPKPDDIRVLHSRFNAVCNAVLQKKSTSLLRALLSNAFCQLPLTIIQVDALIEQMNLLLKNYRRDRSKKFGRQLMQNGFESDYGISFAELEKILANVSKINFKWQKTRNQFVVFHLGLVFHLARQYSTNEQELIDLVQEGNIGLIKAVERFDYRLGYRFSTYAAYWIRLSISRLIARSRRQIRLPYRQNLELGAVNKKKNRFEQLHGRLPDTEELAKETGMSEADLRRLEYISQAVASLDVPLEFGESLDLHSVIEQKNFLQPMDTVSKQQWQGIMGSAINKLSQREAFVIRQRFGVGVYAEKTLQEIASMLGLTRERVRQIEVAGLKKIRFYLEPLTA